MTQELGRIEPPADERFAGKEKLPLIPLPYELPPGTENGLDVLDRYWSQVQSQVASLESRLGSVQRVYHETLTESDDTGLHYLRQAAFRSYFLARERWHMLPVSSPMVSQQLQG